MSKKMGKAACLYHQLALLHVQLQQFPSGGRIVLLHVTAQHPVVVDSDWVGLKNEKINSKKNLKK